MGIFLAFVMNRQLALVFIVCTPLLGIILAVIVRKVAPLYGRQQTCMDQLNRVVQENITAIRAIKAFVRGDREEERFQEANETLTDTSRTTFHYAVLNVPSFQLTMYTAIVLILWFGGNFIQTGFHAGGRAHRLSQLRNADYQFTDDDFQCVSDAYQIFSQRPENLSGFR